MSLPLRKVSDGQKLRKSRKSDLGYSKHFKLHVASVFTGYRNSTNIPSNPKCSSHAMSVALCD